MQGDSFVFGISYWPGYTVTNWGPVYNGSSGVPGLNPCINSTTVNGAQMNYTSWLGNRGAVMTSYAVEVDSMAVLRVTKAEFDQLWDHIPNTLPQAVSMIAFKGVNRSEARYAASAEAYLTQGVGIATEMAMIVSWDKGVFAGLTWYDFQSCANCGGIYSDRCLRLQEDDVYQQYPQTSCAAPFAKCACRGLACVSGNCTTAIYVGHRGTDSKGAAMTSAYQIEQLNQYSFVNWFQSLFMKIDNAYDNSGGLVGGVGQGAVVSVQLPSADASQGSFQAQQNQQTQQTSGNCPYALPNC
ncbi:hypothetical protein N2152v2_009845 [Parachlorella kessleri]